MAQKRTKRSNGEGTIVYEADRKKYRAFLTDPDGKRISKRFDSKADALQWLTETRADIYREEYIPTNDTTLGQWILEYVEEYKKNTVREQTYERILMNINHLKPIADYALQDIDITILQRFFNKLSLAPETQRGIFSLLNSAFKKAIKIGILRLNPMDGVEIKRTQTIVEVFTKQEVSLILETIKTMPGTKQHYVMFLLAFATGLRVGELVALKISNVYDDCIYINSTLVRSKGGQHEGDTKTMSGVRYITLPKEIIKMLHDTHNGENSEYVFHNADMKPYWVNNVRFHWKKILEHCKLPHKKFHTIRHTHATLLIAEGVPITEVSKRLGHKNVKVTLEIYSHFIREYDKTIPDVITKMLSLHPNCSQNPINITQ